LTIEVIGIDHIYLTVSDFEKSEMFYDRIMTILGFQRSKGSIGGDPHIHYFNRHYGFSLRPARNPENGFDAYSPGLHHFCFRVDTVEDVNKFSEELHKLNIEFDKPAFYPEYAPDYYAVFFKDPDGIRLEVTNFRKDRRERFENWEKVKNNSF